MVSTVLVLHLKFTDGFVAMESVLRGHPESCMPFCVQEWDILDLDKRDSNGEPKVLYHEADNHAARREIILPYVAHTSTLGIRILAYQGENVVRGGVFEVRAYGE
jgi:hypothetical protein